MTKEDMVIQILMIKYESTRDEVTDILTQVRWELSAMKQDFIRLMRDKKDTLKSKMRCPSCEGRLTEVDITIRRISKVAYCQACYQADMQEIEDEAYGIWPDKGGAK